MRSIAKGAKLAPLEQDMVARLRLRDDGTAGLGPLAGGLDAASGFVADRASAATVYEADEALSVARGKKAYPTAMQNLGNAVFAARHGADSVTAKEEIGAARRSRSGRHEFVGMLQHRTSL